VRYYRQPPAYFRGWRSDAAPRWGEHWGHDWEQRRPGWNQWNHASPQARAPLPAYQSQYRGDRYPHAEQQPTLHGNNYHYQPREPVVREHYQAQGVHVAPPAARRAPPVAVQERNSERDTRREPGKGRDGDREKGDDRNRK
jgi:hypothetical protein